MSPSQVQSGHAFEYGIACAFGRSLKATLREDIHLSRANRAFTECSDKEKEKIFKASDEIATFLIAREGRRVSRDGRRVSRDGRRVSHEKENHL